MPAPYKSKFSDPRWHSRRDDLLEQADHCCADCDSRDDVQVHICYGDADREPWDWPDESFRCLCHEHKVQRQELDKIIRKILAKFSSPELDPLANALETLVQITSNRMAAMQALYPFAKKRLTLSMHNIE